MDSVNAGFVAQSLCLRFCETHRRGFRPGIDTSGNGGIIDLFGPFAGEMFDRHLPFFGGSMGEG